MLQTPRPGQQCFLAKVTGSESAGQAAGGPAVGGGGWHGGIEWPVPGRLLKCHSLSPEQSTCRSPACLEDTHLTAYFLNSTIVVIISV